MRVVVRAPCDCVRGQEDGFRKRSVTIACIYYFHPAGPLPEVSREVRQTITMSKGGKADHYRKYGR